MGLSKEPRGVPHMWGNGPGILDFQLVCLPEFDSEKMTTAEGLDKIKAILAGEIDEPLIHIDTRDIPEEEEN